MVQVDNLDVHFEKFETHHLKPLLTKQNYELNCTKKTLLSPISPDNQVLQEYNEGTPNQLDHLLFQSQAIK